MDTGPTPEQQADYLVRKLEQTIRDNRTVRGMSFATWQAIAREEIVNAMRAGERRLVNHDRTTGLLVLASAAALVTIGFWGAVVAVEHAWGGTAALASLTAGGVLFVVAARWGIDRAAGSLARRSRAKRLAHIEDLDRRIKRMEAEMTKKHDRVKNQLEKIDRMGEM